MVYLLLKDWVHIKTSVILILSGFAKQVKQFKEIGRNGSKRWKHVKHRKNWMHYDGILQVKEEFVSLHMNGCVMKQKASCTEQTKQKLVHNQV